ncbi:SDR family NAD(P)-dependent oxidoreductase [Aeromicrobium sp. Leaf350]|uniref:SDR family NAD(P)-dependent oxidoreductase n=1 Tax=Aeromicrobium sp. Leaf350 TaxID=2876565 RepID=UPI001E28649D|nr:SDR family oxidoreductase [Aeromicrobium sp. Leaf350]
MFVDKVAVVIGGSSGIGWSTAQSFSQQGATVVIAAAESESALEARVQALDSPHRGWAMSCDVTDRRAVSDLFEHVGNRAGGVDIVVNCAGYHAMTPVFETNSTETDRLIGVNLIGGINVIQGAVQAMHGRGGVVVAVTSTQSVLGEPGQAVYAATKAAIAHYIRSVTPELRRTGIRVVGFAPGAVDTPMVESVSRPTTPEMSAWKERLETYDNSSPDGRFFLQPQEVASAITFLASDGAKAFHGVNLVGDQGRTSALFGLPDIES